MKFRIEKYRIGDPWAAWVVYPGHYFFFTWRSAMDYVLARIAGAEKGGE